MAGGQAFAHGVSAEEENIEDDGKSCETALDGYPTMGMGLFYIGTDYPDGVWYNISVAEGSLFPNQMPAGCADGAIQVFEDCGGKSAIKLGTNSYYLEPETSYKVFIKTDAIGYIGVPMSLANAPAGLYCVKPIEVQMGMYTAVNSTAAKWYKFTAPYAAPLKVGLMTDLTAPGSVSVTTLVTKHLTCDGGTNTANELLPNMAYVKGGDNLVQLALSGSDSFMFTLDAMQAAGCGNNPKYATAIELDAETTYPNAYYTISRKFTVPETGTYTFTNRCAEGSEFSLAKLVEGENGKMVCDFETTPLTAVVGADNEAVIKAAFNEGDVVILYSDAAGVLADGLPYLKVQKTVVEADGKSCETALDGYPTTGMGLFYIGTDYPDGVWYNISVAEGSLFPNQMPAGCADGAIQVFEDCGGKSAIKLGTNSYYLEPETSYKVFIKTDAIGYIGVPMSLANAPAGLYCVKPIEVQMGMYTAVNSTAAKWYKFTAPYAAPLKVGLMTDLTAPGSVSVTTLVTKHLTCDGGTNTANELLPNMAYVKGGDNLVQLALSGSDSFMFTLDAMQAAGCGNNPKYATAIELDAETTYPNAYYTISRKFTVPETGTYTFTNRCAEGSELSLAKLVEDENGKMVCDFETTPLNATAGSDNLAVLEATLNADDVVILYADASGVLADGLPSLKVTRGGTGVRRVEAKESGIKLSENPTSGLFSIKSYLLAQGAEIGIFDMGANKVWGRSVNAGSDRADVDVRSLPAGNYLLVVFGRDRSASAKLIVK